MDADRACALKARLQEIKENGFAPPGDAYSIAREMTEWIGHPDPVLRDDLIYGVFCAWTADGTRGEPPRVCQVQASSAVASRRRPLTTAQIRELLAICLDDRHLLFRCGESGTDSVFTRSFSVLFIPLALEADARSPFLSRDEVRHVMALLLTGVAAERDFRGYVAGKGWAHYMAHAEDALEALAGHRFIGRDDLCRLLDLLWEMAAVDACSYVFSEGERLAAAFATVYRRGCIGDDELLRRVRALCRATPERLPESLYWAENIRGFLRGIYFRLSDPAQPGGFAGQLLDLLRIKAQAGTG